MTPNSPVVGFLRLSFSRNSIELASRIFGTQVLHRSFYPFGCDRRLKKKCTSRQSKVLHKIGSVRRDIPLCPRCWRPRGSQKDNNHFHHPHRLAPRWKTLKDSKQSRRKTKVDHHQGGEEGRKQFEPRVWQCLQW